MWSWDAAGLGGPELRAGERVGGPVGLRQVLLGAAELLSWLDLALFGLKT